MTSPNDDYALADITITGVALALAMDPNARTFVEERTRRVVADRRF